MRRLGEREGWTTVRLSASLMTGFRVWRRILRWYGRLYGKSHFGAFMKTMIRLMAVAVGLMFAQMAVAQAAPAGSTGVCRDGTYTTAPSKKGACRGHKGVKTWLAADAGEATKPAKAEKAAKAEAPAPAAAPAAAPAPAAPAKAARTHESASTMAQAPGGGAGMVWVNSATNVYHCAGTKYYGKTKAGSYMTEAEAKAKGAHADHGHPCSK